MISTDPNGHGGIATVINGYSNDRFLVTNQIIHISSHSTVNSSKLRAMYLFFSCLMKVIYQGITSKIGIAHIHMASRGSYFRKAIVLRLCKLLGAKVILHLHGAEFQAFYNKESTKKKQEHICRTFDLADCVIVLSTQWMDWVQSIISKPSKVKVVYNAVPDLSLDRSQAVPSSILFLGRLGERKGVADLINAFKIVVETNPSATLLLGGDGELDEFKALAKSLGIEQNAKFLGWVAGVEKNKYLASADVYCLPSYNEGFPMGVLEAMSAGIVTVASTAGGIPDAITNEEEGLLITAGDVIALSDALIRVTSDRALNAKFVTAAKHKFDNNFSEKVVFAELDKIYAELLGS